MSETIADKQPGEFMAVAYRCRCGHEWSPKNLRKAERPRTCPRCKSANWDRPKREQKVEN